MYEPGTHFFDNTRVQHPSLIIRDDKTYIIYHVQPFGEYNSNTHKAGNDIY